MQSASAADLIIRNANILTVDPNFTRAEALAIHGERLIAVGSNSEIEKLAGAGTHVLDARGNTILPGLIDSHVHSYRAAVSEFNGPVPSFKSLAQAFSYIRQQAASQPPESWISLQRVYATRMVEGRLPSKAELDAAAPNNPVYWNCGPVSLANSKALQLSGINRNTPNPGPGEVVKDPKTGEPTGLLRNAAQLLKYKPAARTPTPQEQKEAVQHLHQLYNQQGITSISERRTEFASIDLFRELAKSGELTLRVNCTRLMDPVPQSLDEALKKLDEMTHGPGGRGDYGPTGAGDDWVRIGPLKVLLDGGMLIGTAYMREPWGVTRTYQITDPTYRGILNVKPELLNPLYAEAAQRGWQLAAHCTGEASVDVLLDCYQAIHQHMDVRHRRFEICHANFQSPRNFGRCRELGIQADMQPAWLYKDGASLVKTLGEERMKWFEPLQSWFEHGLTIGGGSDHMVLLDSIESTNPWNPWLGMWTALTRQTERGGVHQPAQRLNREQAIRFYTINNARLNFEENKKGSIQPGKYADVIMLDRDVSRCSADELRGTRVLMTTVGGRVVFDSRG